MCRFLAGFLVMVVAAMAAAEEKKTVYRWVDEKGVIHYTDKPPSKDAKPASLPPLQTYGSPSAPAAKDAAAPEPAAPAGAAQISIVSPQPDETFRGDTRQITVSVNVSPELGKMRLKYFLDGSAATAEPVASTSLTLTGLERGSHTVSVALIDEGGRELARANPVTFHVKPPTVARPKPTPAPKT